MNYFYFLFVFCFLPTALFASTGNADKITHSLSKQVTLREIKTKEFHDSVPAKDLSDVVFKRLFQKKATQLKPLHFAMVPAAGYTLQTGWAGIAALQWVYQPLEGTRKASSFTTNFTYSQYNQILVPVVLNYWTNNNRWNLLTDFRYLRYPSSVYGLGGSLDPSQGVTINFSSIKIHQLISREITQNFYAGVGYFYDYAWNINTTERLTRQQLRTVRRELGREERASGYVLRLLYDSRRNSVYPTQGWYVNTIFRDNQKKFSSDNTWQSLLVDVRKHVSLTHNNKNILSFWLFHWGTLGGDPPYLFLPSTGWDDQYNSGRGYIQGRYRGKNMYYGETEYRFNITKNGLLGAVLFANAQYFSDDVSPDYHTLIPGGGGGLRICLNKHSHTHLCIDYGIGKDGSRGFFVNFGEVF